MARDKDLDLLKAIRLCAFGAVKDKAPDYVLRLIFRWYSKTFHTPLEEVDDLPVEHVLTHYFEERYEAMDEAELDQEDESLRETHDERLARERQEVDKKVAADADDDEFYRQVQERAARAEAERIAAVEAAGLAPNLPRPPDRPFQAAAPPTREMVSKPVTLSGEGLAPRPVPENITMTFVDEDELGDLDTWDIMGAPPPPKK